MQPGCNLQPPGTPKPRNADLIANWTNHHGGRYALHKGLRLHTYPRICNTVSGSVATDNEGSERQYDGNVRYTTDPTDNRKLLDPSY